MFIIIIVFCLTFITTFPLFITPITSFSPPSPFAWTQVQNIARDPFDQNVGTDVKSFFNIGGALAGPTTAYVYDWNLLPIGQLLWEKELMSYKDFPPLQMAASYNLDQILEQIKQMGHRHPSQ